VFESLVELFTDVPVDDVCDVDRASVWWVEDALYAFVREAEQWWPLETGASLLGYQSDKAYVVTELVPAGTRARRRRGSFRPDGRWQAAEIARRYAESGRISTYLGDVHSHPAGDCALSRRDRRTVRRIARHSAARQSAPLMAVLAGDRDGWHLGVWQFMRCALRPCRVLPLAAADL
jgi:integrative and conjugative element protein (TIGR02256 family)